jgi:hypothetical protein
MNRVWGRGIAVSWAHLSRSRVFGETTSLISQFPWLMRMSFPII